MGVRSEAACKDTGSPDLERTRECENFTVISFIYTLYFSPTPESNGQGSSRHPEKDLL